MEKIVYSLFTMIRFTETFFSRAAACEGGSFFVSSLYRIGNKS